MSGDAHQNGDDRPSVDEVGETVENGGFSEWMATDCIGSTYDRWNAGEPNGAATERCVIADWSERGPSWTDVPCIWEAACVCQAGEQRVMTAAERAWVGTDPAAAVDL